MNKIDIVAFEYALSITDDGTVFEKFALAFLSAVMGYDFMPAGGAKDRGIDGLQSLFDRKGFDTQKYQVSTEKDTEGKMVASLEKLRKNKIRFDTFRYITNREVKNRDLLCDGLSAKYKRSVAIFDLKWFAANILHSEATVNAYRTYILSNLHEFALPGRSNIVSNLNSDSRLFVFLRQQLDYSSEKPQIDQLLADSLIIMSLEDTDPDKGIFKAINEIKDSIRKLVKFDFKSIELLIEDRAQFLSQKPNRRIVYHSKANAYCLPFETRLQIQERNIRDQQLLDVFYQQTSERMNNYLKIKEVSIRNAIDILRDVVFRIFYQQGLEFASFILDAETHDTIEKELIDVVNSAVDESSIVLKNRELVKSALLMTIRDLVYNGTKEQKDFLKALSNSYMMMFMLHWDPKISTFFHTMANNLKIFVCTSLIIPALSEYYLDPHNRRHWNILQLANKAGVKLYVTEGIISELCSHFRMIMKLYHDDYSRTEDVLTGDESQIYYVNEILIRAYFYAKIRGHVYNFKDFIENFVDPDLKSLESDLVEFLKEQFGISFLPSKSLAIQLDAHEQELVLERLKDQKSHIVKARTDVNTILTVYKLREKNNETAEASIFGYRTWWLSKDVNTYRAVTSVLSDKYPESCYIRPDFLYNYIALTPHPAEVEEAYRNLFPGLIGVNISFHLPSEIADYVRRRMQEFKSKNPGRANAILRRLTEKLKSDPNLRTKGYVEQYLEQEATKLSAK
jgi:hypothetical protein